MLKGRSKKQQEKMGSISESLSARFSDVSLACACGLLCWCQNALTFLDASV